MLLNGEFTFEKSLGVPGTFSATYQFKSRFSFLHPFLAAPDTFLATGNFFNNPAISTVSDISIR